MLIFELHVKTDRKLTIVNKITQNLFLWQSKGIDYQISKEENSNINKIMYETNMTLSTGANRNYFLVNPVGISVFMCLYLSLYCPFLILLY